MGKRSSASPLMSFMSAPRNGRYDIGPVRPQWTKSLRALSALTHQLREGSDMRRCDCRASYHLIWKTVAQR